MQGAGFVTAADAISGMKKIQAREAGEVRTIQRDRNALISSAIEVEEVEEVEEEPDLTDIPSLSGQPEEALGNFSEDRLSRIIKRQTPYDADVITDSPSAFEAKFEVPSENDMPPVGFFFTAIGADQGKGNWDISFRDDTGRHDRTGKLGALRASKVFKTIYDLTDALMKEKSPSSFTLTAAVEITPVFSQKRRSTPQKHPMAKTAVSQ